MKKLAKKVAKSTERKEPTPVETVKVIKSLNKENVVAYIESIAESHKKIIIKCENRAEVEDIFAYLTYEGIQRLAKRGVTSQASTTRFDLHLNGKTYVRFVCEKMFKHYKGLMNYTDVKIYK